MIDIYIFTFVIYLLSTLTRTFNLGVKQDVEVMMELDGSNTLSTVIGVFIIVVSIAIMYKKRSFLVKNAKPLYPILFLYLLALISVLWSGSAFVTLKRFIKIFVYLSFFMSIFVMPEPLKNIKKVLLVFSSVAGISSIILILFFKEYGWMNYGRDYLPCGIFLHKNGLGIFSALTSLMIFMVYELQGISIKKYPLVLRLLFIVLLIELIISGATDVIGGLILGYVLGYLVFRVTRTSTGQLKTLIILLIVTFILCTTFYCFITNLNIIEFYNNSLLSIGKDPTLTGRTDIWPVLLQIGFKSHPMLGSGLGTFFIQIDNSGYSRTLPWLMGHAHNTYLQSYLELGILGFVFSIYIILSLFVKIFFNSYKGTIKYPLIVFFILYNIQTIFEVTLLRPTQIFAFLPIIFYLADYNKTHEKLLNN
jgi:O-antigen ligase